MITVGVLPAGVSITTLLPVMMAPLFGLAMGIVIGRTIAGLGAVVHRDRLAQQQIAVVEAVRAGRDSMHRRRMAEIGADVEPFLQAVADGSTSPADHRVRKRARTLDQAARDELQLPGVLDGPARTALADARADGCVVTLHATAEGAHVATSAALMIRSALVCPRPDRVTLSVYPTGENTTVLMVVVPGNTQRAERMRIDLADVDAWVSDGPAETVVEVVRPG